MRTLFLTFSRRRTYYLLSGQSWRHREISYVSNVSAEARRQCQQVRFCTARKAAHSALLLAFLKVVVVCECVYVLYLEITDIFISNNNYCKFLRYCYAHHCLEIRLIIRSYYLMH